MLQYLQCNNTIKIKNARRTSQTLKSEPDQGNQIKKMGTSPNKLQVAVSTNTSTTKEITEVNDKHKTLNN
jgi:hypothetical protein